MAVSRQIGRIGTAARAIVGVAVIVFAFAAEDLGVWDIVGAVAVLPILALLLYLGVSRAYESTPLRSSSATARAWALSVSVLVLVLAIGTALTFVTPIDAGSIFLFFGVSLLVVAARGDAGCEVLGIVNALAGRREATGCIAFAPVDSAEARLAGRASP